MDFQEKTNSFLVTKHNTHISALLAHTNSKAGRYFRRFTLFIFIQLLNPQNAKLSVFLFFFEQNMKHTPNENNVIKCLIPHFWI